MVVPWVKLYGDCDALTSTPDTRVELWMVHWKYVDGSRRGESELIDSDRVNFNRAPSARRDRYPVDIEQRVTRLIPGGEPGRESIPQPWPRLVFFPGWRGSRGHCQTRYTTSLGQEFNRDARK